MKPSKPAVILLESHSGHGAYEVSVDEAGQVGRVRYVVPFPYSDLLWFPLVIIAVVVSVLAPSWLTQLTAVASIVVFLGFLYTDARPRVMEVGPKSRAEIQASIDLQGLVAQ